MTGFLDTLSSFHINFVTKISPLHSNKLTIITGGNGTLVGVIEDGDSFTKLENVKVSISSLGRYTYTDVNGEFEIQSLPVGTYTVEIGEGEDAVYLENIKVTSGDTENIGINKAKRTMRLSDFAEFGSEYDAREAEWIKYRGNDAVEKSVYLWQNTNGNYHQAATSQTDPYIPTMPYHDTVKKCVRFDGVYNRLTYTPYKSLPRGNYKSGFLVVSNAKGGVEENTGVVYSETRVMGSSPYSGDEENAWGLNQVILGTGKNYTVKLQNIKGKCNINGYEQYPASGYADEIVCPTPTGFNSFPVDSNELTIVGFDLEKSEGVYSLGMAKGPTGKVTFNGLDVYRVVLFDDVLSQADRQKAEGILAYEHNIQSKLPSWHPYKTIQPKIEYPELTDDLVGINVDWFFDTSPFVDAMKTAWTWSGPLDINGDPTGDSTIQIMNYREGVLNPRTYSCSCLGNALPTIDVTTATTDGSGTTATISNLSRDQSGNITFTLTVPAVIKQLILSFTNTSGGIRNLKILDNLYPSTQLLTDWFADMYRGYNVLRFMEVVVTNSSTEQYWTNRINPKKGNSWESLIDISNELQTNMWINIPHLADSNYVTNLANLIHSRLDSNLDVYVEYSNECWNGLKVNDEYVFKQFEYLINQDAARNSSDPAYLAIEAWNNGFLKIAAEKAYNAAKIFKTVFGPTSLNNRVKFILGAQSRNLPSLEVQLRFLEDYYAPMKVKDYFYGTAVAFYVDAQFEGDVQDIADETQLEIEKINSLIYITPHLLLSRKYGIDKLVSYEGGYDIVGGRAFSETSQAQRDYIHSPQGVEQMNHLVEMFNNYSDGGLAVWYKGGRHSAWGVTTSIDVLNSPKSEELKKYIEERKKTK